MEIVFYDLETTIPATDIIEFGAIVLDKDGLYEKETYSTLIYSSAISDWSINCNGITPEMVKDAPQFSEVADKIFDILDGKIWAGHNILAFDNVHLTKAFTNAGKKAPEYCGVIDTKQLLQRHFGKRAGDIKLASLGQYFGLGQEEHRAIEDCRMNLDVLKNCAMTLFLEEHADFASVAGKKVQDEKETIQRLEKAITKKEVIWISYDGGANPLAPRQISPVKWLQEPWFFKAHCHHSRTAKNFSTRKIIEIRTERWQVER